MPGGWVDLNALAATAGCSLDDSVPSPSATPARQKHDLLDIAAADADILCVQELARGPHGWDEADTKEFHWIMHRDDAQWRGVGIAVAADMFDSTIRKVATKRGIWALIRLKGLGRVVCGSLHAHTGVTTTVYQDAISEFFGSLPGKWRQYPLICGVDSNEKVAWLLDEGDSETGLRVAEGSSNFNVLLDAALKEGCQLVAPDACQRHQPTHFPRDEERRGKQIDLVLVRHVDTAKLCIEPDRRHVIGSDHAFLHFEVMSASSRSARWGGDSRARYMCKDLYDETIVDEDDLIKLAAECSKPRRSRAYQDTDEIKEAIKHARHSNDKTAWKTVHKMRRHARIDWQRGRLARILDGSWDEFRQLQSEKKRRRGWWGEMLVDRSARELTSAVCDHFEKKMVDPGRQDWDDELDSMIGSVSVEGDFQPFTILDIRVELQAMRARSAVGPDGLGVDFLRHAASHETIGPQLCELVNHIVSTLATPASWRKSFLALLAKTKHPRHPGDLRPIAVSSAFNKLVNRLVCTRTMPACRRGSSVSSCGKGRQAADLIGAASRIRDVVHEWRLPAVLGKLDVAGAFDRVDRRKIVLLLNERLCDPKLGRELRYLLHQLHTHVLEGAVPGGNLITIVPNNGIKQGAPESAEIFGLVVDWLLSDLVKTNKWRAIGETLPGLGVDVMFYQDDIFLVDHDLKSLARRIRVIDRCLQTAGLALATNKTKIVGSPSYSGPRHVKIGEDDFKIAPLGESLKILGLSFSLAEKPSQQAQELLARTRAAAAAHKDILQARGAWTKKISILRSLVESQFAWTAGAVHWSSSDLAAANTMQLQSLLTDLHGALLGSTISARSRRGIKNLLLVPPLAMVVVAAWSTMALPALFHLHVLWPLLRSVPVLGGWDEDWGDFVEDGNNQPAESWPENTWQPSSGTSSSCPSSTMSPWPHPSSCTLSPPTHDANYIMYMANIWDEFEEAKQQPLPNPNTESSTGTCQWDEEVCHAEQLEEFDLGEDLRASSALPAWHTPEWQATMVHGDDENTDTGPLASPDETNGKQTETWLRDLCDTRPLRGQGVDDTGNSHMPLLRLVVLYLCERLHNLQQPIPEESEVTFQVVGQTSLNGENVVQAVTFYGEPFTVWGESGPTQAAVAGAPSSLGNNDDPQLVTDAAVATADTESSQESSEDMPNQTVGFWRNGEWVPRPRTASERRQQRGGNGPQRAQRKQARLDRYFRGEWLPAWLEQYKADKAQRSVALASIESEPQDCLSQLSQQELSSGAASSNAATSPVPESALPPTWGDTSWSQTSSWSSSSSSWSWWDGCHQWDDWGTTESWTWSSSSSTTSTLKPVPQGSLPTWPHSCYPSSSTTATLSTSLDNEFDEDIHSFMQLRNSERARMQEAGVPASIIQRLETFLQQLDDRQELYGTGAEGRWAIQCMLRRAQEAEEALGSLLDVLADRLEPQGFWPIRRVPRTEGHRWVTFNWGRQLVPILVDCLQAHLDTRLQAEEAALSPVVAPPEAVATSSHHSTTPADTVSSGSSNGQGAYSRRRRSDTVTSLASRAPDSQNGEALETTARHADNGVVSVARRRRRCRASSSGGSPLHEPDVFMSDSASEPAAGGVVRGPPVPLPVSAALAPTELQGIWREPDVDAELEESATGPVAPPASSSHDGPSTNPMPSLSVPSTDEIICSDNFLQYFLVSVSFFVLYYIGTWNGIIYSVRFLLYYLIFQYFVVFDWVAHFAYNLGLELFLVLYVDVVYNKCPDDSGEMIKYVMQLTGVPFFVGELTCMTFFAAYKIVNADFLICNVSLMLLWKSFVHGSPRRRMLFLSMQEKQKKRYGEKLVGTPQLVVLEFRLPRPTWLLAVLQLWNCRFLTLVSYPNVLMLLGYFMDKPLVVVTIVLGQHLDSKNGVNILRKTLKTG
ncbi:unnamed protein product [Symbiodinium microadriaticum]|nr:unnamed protein product [Symbiodinium microadriaticum]